MRIGKNRGGNKKGGGNRRWKDDIGEIVDGGKNEEK